MLFRLILLLTLIPILELMVLLQVHQALSHVWGSGPGLIATLGSIVVTGIAGAALARQQGFAAIANLQRSLSQGKFPGEPILDGVLILLGAALLLTPGLLTDALGFCLLIPATRVTLRRRLRTWIEEKIRRGEMRVVVVESERSVVQPRDDGPVDPRLP